MSKALDIVGDFVALAQGAGIEADAARRLGAAIRRTYGGQKVMVLHREPITLEQIDGRLRTGKSVAVIAVELGTSRATIYRHLRAKVSRIG